MVVIWLSPLLLFATLIVVFRIKPIWAASVCALMMISVGLTVSPDPASLEEIAFISLSGFWIALPAVLVILAGLFFAECLESRESVSTRSADDGEAKDPGRFNSLATYCLLIGPFMESSTGFGVGYVVALAGIMKLGVTGGHAIALAGFSQFLVPWGALAIGTQIAADISGIPIGELAVCCALITAVSASYVLPLFWRLAAQSGCGPRQRDQIDWVATFAVLMALLVVANVYVPMEFAALIALGGVIAARHGVFHGKAALSRETIIAATPYIALIVLLAVSRLYSPVKQALDAYAIAPFEELNAFSLASSPALPLLIVGGAFAMRSGGMAQLTGTALTTFRRGWPAAVLTFALVAVAWIMLKTGISSTLMTNAEGIFGPAASVLIAFAGAVGGYLTGSNAGAAAISMPLITGLSVGATSASWVAASAVFAGSALTAISPIRISMGTAYLAATDVDGVNGLSMMLPYTISALTLSCATVALALML